jgi:hypothetical protein
MTAPPCTQNRSYLGPPFPGLSASCARVLAAMLSKLTRASAPTATLAAIFLIFASRIMLVFFPFREDVSVTTQGPTLSLPMAADPTVQIMWTCRCRCHADRSSPRSNWEPQSKIWFQCAFRSLAAKPWDVGGSPLLRHAATESPNSTRVICSGLERR